MHKIFELYSRLGSFLNAGRLYLFLGINLIVLSVLIFIYPNLVAYLIASFLLVNGAILVGLGMRARKNNRYDNFWQSPYRV